MAIALVQKKGAQTVASAASLDVTLDSPPTAGNLLVACCNSDATVSTPAGFTLAVSSISSQGLYIFYRVVQGGDSATVTFTPSVSDSVAAGVLEYSGLVTSSPLDKTASGNAGDGSTTVSTGTTATTSQASDLVIVCAGPHNPAGGATFSLTSWTGGFTTQVSEGHGVGAVFVGCFIGDLIVAATGTYGSTATYSPAGDAGAAVATFKGAGGTAMPLAADGLAASSGTADVTVKRTLASAGMASSAGAADIVVQRVLATQGMASSAGAATIAVQAVLAANGLAASSGTADIGVTVLALAADGKASSSGAASLNLRLSLAATGMASSSGTAAFPVVGPPYVPGPTAARRIA